MRSFQRLLWRSSPTSCMTEIAARGFADGATGYSVNHCVSLSRNEARQWHFGLYFSLSLSLYPTFSLCCLFFLIHLHILGPGLSPWTFLCLCVWLWWLSSGRNVQLSHLVHRALGWSPPPNPPPPKRSPSENVFLQMLSIQCIPLIGWSPQQAE